MNETILEQLNKIFIEVLDNPSIILFVSTTANDIDEWDSLSNIELIVAIEKKFKIKFTSNDIEKWNNIYDIINTITVKYSR